MYRIILIEAICIFVMLFLFILLHVQRMVSELLVNGQRIQCSFNGLSPLGNLFITVGQSFEFFKLISCLKFLY